MTTPRPIISQKLDSEIWRMEVDEATATLLLELRNESEKLVSFASVDLSKGRLNFNNYTTPERWLTGIEAAFDGVLLLHNYQSANGPVHRAITAIDVYTGETLWSNYTLAFDHLSINGPVVYNTQILPQKHLIIDVKTGAILRPYNTITDAELVKDIALPDVFTEEEYTGPELPDKVYGNRVHYLEYNCFKIISLHTLNNNLLQQHLYIFNDEGLVYKDLLNADIQKLQPEAFVLHKNCLICLKNKTELIVLTM